MQYVDDENTLINLRANDSFMDTLRCAVTVPGATFHRLKVNILWQPKSTPEMKRQEMRASTTTCTGKNNGAELKDPLKKQLNFENPESPARAGTMSEPESSDQKEEEAANALVQLQRNNIPENTH